MLFVNYCLSPSEYNYDIENRELLAVKLTLEKWWNWLKWSRILFVVWMDHKNLEYIRTTSGVTFLNFPGILEGGRP